MLLEQNGNATVLEVIELASVTTTHAKNNDHSEGPNTLFETMQSHQVSNIGPLLSAQRATACMHAQFDKIRPMRWV